MTVEPKDPLGPLRRMPLDITLEASMQRAAALHARHQRVRRTVVSIISVAAIIGAAMYLLRPELPPAALHTEARPSTSGTSAPTVAPAVPTTPPATKTTYRPRMKMVVPLDAVDDAVVVPADVAMVQALAVDLRAVDEIRAHLGSGDRVVVVDNTTDQETCIQVTCEGGDARSIVCTAPSPSPVRVTTVKGALLYDIDRADGEDRPGPYVAVRTAVGEQDVLLWYAATPDLQRKLGTEVRGLPAERSWLRPDHATSILRGTGSASWTSVAVRYVDGTSASVAARWIDHHDGRMELVLQDARRGTYDVEVRRVDGTRDRFLHVVR